MRDNPYTPTSPLEVAAMKLEEALEDYQRLGRKTHRKIKGLERTDPSKDREEALRVQKKCLKDTNRNIQKTSKEAHKAWNEVSK